MNRRNFINTLGLGFSGLPLSKSLFASKKSDQSKNSVMNKNIVLVGTSYGLLTKEHFRPENADLESRYLNIFGDLRNKMTVLNSAKSVNMGSNHPSHPNIFSLTHRSKATSLDMFLVNNLAQSTRLPYLTMGTGKFKESVSWNKAQPIPMITDVESVRKKLLKEKESTETLLFKKKYMTKMLKLSSSNNFKRHKNTFEDLIANLENQIKWSKAKLPVTDYEFQLPQYLDKRYSYPETTEFLNLRSYFDLAEIALVHKQTKIVTLNIFEGGTTRFPGVVTNWHSLTHTKAKQDELMILEEFQLKEIYRFANNLEKKNILDDTIILFVGGFGQSYSHSTDNLPVMVIGGGLKHQGLIECKDSAGKLIFPMANLYTTLIHACGGSCNNQFAGLTGNFDKYFGV